MTKTRVIAALIMAPLAICAIVLLPTQWLAALAAILFLTGLWEWLKLSGIDDSLPRTVLLVLNLLLMVLMVWASAGSMVLFEIATLVGVAWWLVALLWLRFFTFGAGNGQARALKLAAGTLALLPAWAALVLLHANPDKGNLWLLTALTMVWAADSAAYFAGRAFGKHKLAQRISPNKTIEGLLGGMLAGIAVACAFGWLAGLTLARVPQLMLLSAVAVLASVLGDLFESLLKRQAGAKDSGTVIPGHGGVLDRIDGVLAALPVFALGKEILGF
ncbi:phosphatidate cytidylyltransferase [Xanthomonas fragariae]|uniref:Phosphatidate cytidylyltransferase n=2 Tax=Xanthomonas fragariae TaxID=48664 RepID=A0A1Y6HDI9_9XANT|nr:phosphatidate cytidylyltransferase [Xanthomonas fragariae]AOD14426.1 phosphatidate cytidylyltransferase [Xanthomonas fragariae]AOD17816.1 phosphatidate cytidylyltransferase [Xanthomonas fragariae]ENZ94763.1 phosphatidate cytidylyltransferase [Xanthomonas fragariae LMG 25863]MBL9196191.1 phosphatidate cytidylyltransferase [Xanthomonas fragariae]MBL9220301.1 phosphatidate cytidylyltransferase [Xanthomonas fragariae]